jgi:hypothetical protein
MRAFENFLRFEKVLALRLQISVLRTSEVVYTFSEKCLGDTSIYWILISSFRVIGTGLGGGV